MNQYFPKPYRTFGGNINVKVDLSNYTTKTDLENATAVDTSKLAAKSDLVSLKAEFRSNGSIKSWRIDKLKHVPADWSKLKNVVNNDVVKKTLYDKLVAKVKNIDTFGFVLKIKYTVGKSDSEKKLVMQTTKFLTLADLLKNTL